jgi:hypothetical protein
VNEVVKINAIRCVLFQVRYTSAYGGALFTFIKFSSSPLWHLPDAQLTRPSPQSVLLLGYHVYWDAALVTMERQWPLQTLPNQFFMERLHINMAACSATLVGLSATTPTYLEWPFALL